MPGNRLFIGGNRLFGCLALCQVMRVTKKRKKGRREEEKEEEGGRRGGTVFALYICAKRKKRGGGEGGYCLLYLCPLHTCALCSSVRNVLL